MQEGISYSIPSTESSYNRSMERDPVRTSILEAAEQLDLPLAEISRRLGRNHSYLQQFIKRGTPAELPEDVRQELARIIGLREEQLRGPRAQQAVNRPNAQIGGPAAALWHTVPVYGHAVGGDDGQFVLNGNKITDILAPSSLAGVPGAYAVYVAGESMLERYQPGEAVFVNPRLPIRRGDFVVAQIRGADADQPEAYIKRFISKEASWLRLEQLNPKKLLKFPTQRVVSIHRVLKGGE